MEKGDFRLVPFPNTNVAIIIVTNDDENKFCCTDEPAGWNLPCGMVDVGESFKTAAKRETYEEAGVKVQLTGILRMEFMFGREHVRFRSIFTATQKDPSAKLKSIPDKETFGAAWLSMRQIEGIGKGDAVVLEEVRSLPHRVEQENSGSEINDKKIKLRCGEVISLFKWYSSKTTVFPLKILKTVKGKVMKDKFKSASLVSVGILFFDTLSNKYFLERTSRRHMIPFSILQSLKYLEFSEFANEVFHKVLAEVFDGKQKKSSFFDLKGRKKGADTLSGICGIYHEAPVKEGGVSKFHVTYYCAKEVKKPKDEVGDWFSKDEILKDSRIDTETRRVVNNHANNIIAPIEFLSREGSPYTRID